MNSKEIEKINSRIKRVNESVRLSEDRSATSVAMQAMVINGLVVYARDEIDENTVTVRGIGLVKKDTNNQVIVCPAIRGADGLVMSCFRHGSVITEGMIRMTRNPSNWMNRKKEDLGFLDNYGEYLTRSEAYKVAKNANQIDVVEDDSSGMLVDEMLY